MTTAGGWKAIRYTLRMANRVGWLALWRAMRSQNACKTCALGHGRPARRHGQRGGPLAEVCKKSLQAMAADMQSGHRAGVLRALLHRPAAHAVAARAGIVRPARRAALRRRRATRTTASSPGTRRSSRLADQLKASGPSAASSTPAAARRTKPASCCSSSPARSAPTTSTTARTTATRRAASGWRRASAPARRRCSSRTSSTATCSS